MFYPILSTVSRPIIEKFVADLRAENPSGKIGATGYCWGGRYAILLADGKVDAATAFHPAFLAVTADYEKVTKPLSIGTGDKDSMFSNEDQVKTKEYFAKEKKDVQFEFVEYPNEVHGFSVVSLDFSYFLVPPSFFEYTNPSFFLSH